MLVNFQIVQKKLYLNSLLNVARGIYVDSSIVAVDMGSEKKWLKKCEHTTIGAMNLAQRLQELSLSFLQDSIN